MNFETSRDALWFLLGALAAGLRPALATEWLRWYRLVPDSGHFLTRFPQPTDRDVEIMFERRTRFAENEARMIAMLHSLIQHPGGKWPRVEDSGEIPALKETVAFLLSLSK